jgi:hypothetical protein
VKRFERAVIQQAEIERKVASTLKAWQAGDKFIVVNENSVAGSVQRPFEKEEA